MTTEKHLKAIQNQLKEIFDLAESIRNYVDAPHWNNDRKYRMREKAVKINEVLVTETKPILDQLIEEFTN